MHVVRKMKVITKHQNFVLLTLLVILILLNILMCGSKINVQHYLKPENCRAETSRHHIVDESKHFQNEATSRSLLLPSVSILDSMDDDQLTELYWKYVNTLQVLCRNQSRLGSLRDGGKEVCLDKPYIPKSPCLVYSYGSNFQFDFEVDVVRNFQCEVHTFDPSKEITDQIPFGITYHLTGLSNQTFINTQQWKMETLSNIRTILNHTDRKIDILKIDVEGSEWVALPQIFRTGDLKDVKQLNLEVHFGETPESKDITYGEKLKILKTLYELGFRIFQREHNLFSVVPFSKTFPTIAIVNEISLINVNYM